MIKLALLDLYDGTPNLGIGNIMDILDKYPILKVDRYDVRGKAEVPGLDYDIYISSGGPGSPLEGDGIWDRAYFYLMDRLWKHNQESEEKKYAFFICHSFQMIAFHLGLGSITKRKSESFGIYPIHLTVDGEIDKNFEELDNPFYAADFRKWQLTEPYHKRLDNLNCAVLAIEKLRPHINLERAIMAMRFSSEWLGVQFHPEADPIGMLHHFKSGTKKEVALEMKGKEKYDEMIDLIADESGLTLTHKTILPRFLEDSIMALSAEALSL